MKSSIFNHKHAKIIPVNTLIQSGKLIFPTKPDLCFTCKTNEIPENLNGIMINRKCKTAENFSFCSINDGNNLFKVNIPLNTEIMDQLTPSIRSFITSGLDQLDDGKLVIILRTKDNVDVVDKTIHILSEELGADFSSLMFKVPIYLEGLDQTKHSSDLPREFYLLGRKADDSQLHIFVDELTKVAELAYIRLLKDKPNLYDIEKREFFESNTQHVWIDMEEVIGVVIFPGKKEESTYIKLQTTFMPDHIRYHAYPDTYANWLKAIKMVIVSQLKTLSIII